MVWGVLSVANGMPWLLMVFFMPLNDGSTLLGVVTTATVRIRWTRYPRRCFPSTGARVAALPERPSTVVVGLPDTALTR